MFGSVYFFPKSHEQLECNAHKHLSLPYYFTEWAWKHSEALVKKEDKKCLIWFADTCISKQPYSNIDDTRNNLVMLS